MSKKKLGVALAGLIVAGGFGIYKVLSGSKGSDLSIESEDDGGEVYYDFNKVVDMASRKGKSDEPQEFDLDGLTPDPKPVHTGAGGADEFGNGVNANINSPNSTPIKSEPTIAGDAQVVNESEVIKDPVNPSDLIHPTSY